MKMLVRRSVPNALVEGLGWEKERAERYVDGAVRELGVGNVYLPAWVVSASKSMVGELRFGWFWGY